jgi:hypothetical protein
LSDDVTGLKSAVEQLDANVITDSAGPASIVSIADGADGMPMRKVEVAIEPVQDLHGYDSPWPAGGGKNVLPYRDDIVNATVDGITYTINKDADGNVISITANGTATQNTIFHISNRVTFPAGSYILSGCPSGGSNPGYMLFDRIEYFSGYEVGNGISATQASEHEIWIAIRITSGITVNNVVFKPMIRPATESDASFAPYSNICPISGWTGAKVTRCGKNLCGGEPMKNALLTIADASAGSDADGEYVSFAADKTAKNKLFASFKSDTQYTVVIRYKKSNTSLNSNMQIIYTDGTTQTIITADTYEEGKLFTAIAISQVGKTISYIRSAYFSGTTLVYYDQCGVFEGVLTEDQFEPYQGQTYEVAFPSEAGTVYGGELTVNEDGSGQLVVDMAKETYDENSGFSSVGDSVTYPMYYHKAVSSNYKKIITCNEFVNTYINWNNFSNGIRLIGSDFRVRYTPLFNNLTEFNAWIANNNIEVLYELTTPITYTLTAQQVKTLLGQNNIWADTGNIAVTYPADTKLYIDNKIAELQALILENNG